jgi:hypothetical protein
MNDKYLLNLDERMDDSFTLHASRSTTQHGKVTEYAKKYFMEIYLEH